MRPASGRWDAFPDRSRVRWRQAARLPPPDAAGPALLILPAPFKRAYIWDLGPQVSVVRRCSRGLRVFLLEWTPPSLRQDGFGLVD